MISDSYINPKRSYSKIFFEKTYNQNNEDSEHYPIADAFTDLGVQSMTRNKEDALGVIPSPDTIVDALLNDTNIIIR